MIVNIPDDWTPSSENINALPMPLREYIMRLHANTDPAGELRRAMVAEMERDALRKMMEWQPIETAPMDGSKVLLWSPVDGVFSSHCEWGHWQGMPWRKHEAKLAAMPTHWMPLPEAPDERG